MKAMNEFMDNNNPKGLGFEFIKHYRNKNKIRAEKLGPMENKEWKLVKA